MAYLVLTKARVWYGSPDDTGAPSLPMVSPVEVKSVASISLEDSADTPEVTVFGDTTRRHIAGLTDANGSIEALIDDDATTGNFDALRSAYGKRKQWTISPTGAGKDKSSPFTATEPGYVFNATLTTRPALAGAVGDVARQTLNFKVDGEVITVNSGNIAT